MSPAASTAPPPKVAVLNDSRDNVELLAAWLRHHGFSVVGATVQEFRGSASSFAEFVRTNRPTLLLVDVGFPYEENWAFVRSARDLVTIGHLPLIVTTTSKRILESLVGPTDALEVLAKPYDLDQVTRVVRAALTRRREDGRPT